MPRLLVPLFVVVASAGIACSQESEPALAPKAKAAPRANPHAYVPYRGHDLAAVVKLAGNGDEHAFRIDGALLEAVVDDLFAHARSYPTSFGDDAEKAIAVGEVEALSEVLAIAIGEAAQGEDLPILVLAGQLEAVGHNLEVVGSTKRARSYFERILKADPKHHDAHLHFGMHLVGIRGGAKEALPHLRLAHEHGHGVALRGIGLAHLMLGERDQAIACLREWLANNEGDVGVARWIDALSHGAESSPRTVEGDAEEKQQAATTAPESAQSPAAKPGTTKGARSRSAKSPDSGK